MRRYSPLSGWPVNSAVWAWRGQVKQPLCIDLAATSVPAEHFALYESLVVEAYERGRPLNIEWLFDIDNVIDSAATFVFHAGANRSLSSLKTLRKYKIQTTRSRITDSTKLVNSLTGRG